MVERQEWFFPREHLVLDTFYYEGDVKTLLKGGGDILLADITAQNGLNTRVDDLIAETTDLKTEVQALKEMLSQLLAQLPS